MAIQGISTSGLDAVLEKRFQKRLDVDMEVGTLFGYDATKDKFVKANAIALSGDIVEPIGIIVDGSYKKWGKENDLAEGETVPVKSIAEAGTFVTVEKYAVLEAEVGDYTKADMADNIRFYAGADGAITKIKPVATGDLQLEVGYLLDPVSIKLDVTKKGTIV